MSQLIFKELKGAQKMLNVYDDHVTLTQVQNIRSILTHNWFQGEKEIYYFDMTSIQYKAPSTYILGYIQFEVPGIRSTDNFNSENSWTFESSLDKTAKEVCNYIRNRIREIKQPQLVNTVKEVKFSPADEILKLKKLLDAGIITQEEFDAKKKQLLGL